MVDVKQKAAQMIKRARKAKGLTLEEAGHKVGVAKSTFSLYESGKQNLTVETLQKIADAFEIDFQMNMQ